MLLHQKGLPEGLRIRFCCLCRVPLCETQAVTHQKDINGGALGTTTLVYRPLSTQSALSSAGAVGPGESADNCVYYLPRQHIAVPEALLSDVFRGLMEYHDNLHDDTKWSIGGPGMTERGVLELLEYLRHVLLRGMAEIHGECPEAYIFKKYPFNSRMFQKWAAEARTEIDLLKAGDRKARLQRETSPAVREELCRLHVEVRKHLHLPT